MIGSLGALGAINTLGLEAPIVGFTTGSGGGGPPADTFALQTDSGVNIQTDSGVQIEVDH